VGDMPPPCHGFATQFEDVAGSLLAVRILRTARPLDTSGLVGPTSDSLVLRDGEPAQVDTMAQALQRRLVELVGSSHPGGGYALAVGMARLAALDRTRRSGRWVLLESFPPDAPAIPAARVARWHGTFEELAAVARQDLDRARAALTGRVLSDVGAPERELGAVEAAASRLHEIEAALHPGWPLRIAPDPMLPARTTRLTGLESDRSLDELLRARDAAGARARAYAAAVQQLYPYELAGRNCVTELFRTLDDAFGGTADRRAEWERRLGGAIDPAGALDFIPFVSARTLDARLAVAETAAMPSFRRQRLDALAARGATPWVRLREASTVTSTIYRRNPDDSTFVFFTDDAVAVRPLLGLVNLAAGLGVGAAGLVTLPLDRGELLGSGLRGALFSIPELAFFNIRKGSFTTVSDGTMP